MICLKKGNNKIIPSKNFENKNLCALMALKTKCKISTQGLNWNLGEGLYSHLEFGINISTSNQIVGDEVFV
jgi:hypothetical protein